MNLDAKLAAADIARALGVSRQLVNYWRASGRLKPVDGHGATRYRLGDAVLVDRDARRSGQSSRRLRVAA